MALVKVAETADIPAGRCKRVLIKRRPITVFNCAGEYFAIDDTCTHDEASLAGGDVEGCVVTCPLHGAQFDIKTGAALSLPAATPVETYKVTLDGTAIMVEV